MSRMLELVSKVAYLFACIDAFWLWICSGAAHYLVGAMSSSTAYLTLLFCCFSLDGVCVVLFLAARRVLASLLRQPAFFVLVWVWHRLCMTLVSGCALASLRRLACLGGCDLVLAQFRMPG
jgi:hypothetical protein